MNLWISEMFVLYLCPFNIYFTFNHIWLFWGFCYIDCFDSYVGFLIWLIFWVFLYWKWKNFWNFVLCFSNSLLNKFVIWKIKHWNLFVNAFDIYWLGLFLLNYLSGTQDAICHHRITHVILQIWFAMNLVSNFF